MKKQVQILSIILYTLAMPILGADHKAIIDKAIDKKLEYLAQKALFKNGFSFETLFSLKHYKKFAKSDVTKGYLQYYIDMIAKKNRFDLIPQLSLTPKSILSDDRLGRSSVSLNEYYLKSTRAAPTDCE